MSALQPAVLQSPTTEYTVRISAARGVLSAASAAGLTVSTANGQVTIVGTADTINGYLRSAKGLSYQGSGRGACEWHDRGANDRCRLADQHDTGRVQCAD